MTIFMLRQAIGVANKYGSVTRTYDEGEELSNNEDWEQERNADFLSRGLAEETKVVKPTETKDTAPVRARNADGTLIGDDEATPNYNEAWQGGVSPKKRGRPKKTET